MLSYRGVSKSFNYIAALNGVTVDFEPGMVHALLGPNGAGKSTMFRMAIGLVKPDSGAVRVEGVDPSREPILARRIVGYVPEEMIIYESLTPSETFSFLGSLYHIDKEILVSRVERLSKSLGIWKFMDEIVGTLSYGIRRRLQIAYAMVHEPRVLVFDEPFSGLDLYSAMAVVRMLREKAEEGRTVVFSTHILQLAETTADMVTLIDKGKIVGRGTPRELYSKYSAKNLQELFLRLQSVGGECWAL